MNMKRRRRLCQSVALLALGFVIPISSLLLSHPVLNTHVI